MPSNTCLPQLMHFLSKSLYIAKGLTVGASETISCCNKNERFVLCALENCPDHNLMLSKWKPGNNSKMDVVVRNGERLKLIASATMRSLTIQSGGKA